jgi:4-hydroxyphenylpyruvate dioxygenase
MGSLKESLGIQRIAALHVFVRDLERSRNHYVDRLDFAEIAVGTSLFEAEHRARAVAVEAGGARFVFMEPLGSKGESFRWLEKHPEGVARVVFQVADAERAFDILRERRATPMTRLESRTWEGVAVRWFDIATAIGDTIFRFVESAGPTPILPGLVRVSPPRNGTNRFGFTEFDHITSNFLTLEPALMWMEQVMGFERYWDVAFHTLDVKGAAAAEGSGLRSTVMWDPGSGLKFANNEPAPPFFEASQIFLFCEDHRGAGIQHVALAVGDIITAVRELRARGLAFMPTPAAYYDMLPDRLVELGVNQIEEDLTALRELEVLVDGGAPGRYLLQIFMKEAAQVFHDPQAGPLFLEILQRKGDDGFGAGNFRALFESIERQQQSEGRSAAGKASVTGSNQAK